MDRNFVAKRLLAVGMIPDGRRVEISEIETRDPMQGHDDTKHYAVDVGAGYGMPAASFGFLSESDAYRFVTSYDEQEYPGYDAFGRRAVTVRHGLGCPDALLSKRGGGLQINTGAGDGEPVRLPSFNVSGANAGAVSAGVPSAQSITSRSGPAPAATPAAYVPAGVATVEAYTPAQTAVAAAAPVVNAAPAPVAPPAASPDGTHVDTSLPGLESEGK